MNNTTDYLQIMIIDDEYPVRSLLKNCIDWESLHARVCADAASASEAYAYMKTAIPDILFVDINLPVENGIDFSRNILNLFPQIRIIILTGYEEFNYIQECLRIGVSDFITKPIDVPEIEAAVRKVRLKIMNERNKHQAFENTSQLLNESFAGQLIHGLVTPEQIYMQNDNLKKWMAADIFQTTLLKSQRPFSQNLLFRLREIVYGTEHLLCAVLDETHTAVINNRPELAVTQVLLPLYQLAQEEGNPILTGIGCARSGMNGAYVSSDEALLALHHLLENPHRNSMRYIDLIDVQTGGGRQDRLNVARICQYIRTGHTEKANVLIHQALETYQSILSINLCREAAIEITSAIIECLNELHIDHKYLRPEEENLYKKIFLLNSYTAIADFLEELTAHSVALIKGKSEADVIKDICLYMDKSFRDSTLNLQTVANAFHLNYSYLSRLFKKRIGNSFSEYLLNLRMNEAERLLTHTDLKIYEIADNVGFSDPHYLEICFKKWKGSTMSSYRLEKRND